ncbi:MAG TPA: fumarylacetoacetate hydrolase family protein [Casimicrobiaceae bacterium]|nr:fumarylacetoacetate hydrolase family protein [Casimicrobiaceae bacterium]
MTMGLARESLPLVRFMGREDSQPRIGLVQENAVFDVTNRYASIGAFVAQFADGWTASSVALREYQRHRLDEVTLAPPIDDASTLYLVGANYRQHAEEAGLSVPKTPVFFDKPPTALVGHEQPIVLPPISAEMDYEGELAVVIGRKATRVTKEQARGCVAGYTIVNDITARDLQWVELGKHRIVDWFSSKSLDASSPVGPWIVPASTAGDPHGLRLRTMLNGEVMQDSDTSLMVFSVWDLIEFASARVTLRPGDIISTGTPFGVGGFRKIFLKPGDRLEVAIEGVGTLRNGVERR